MKKDILLSAIAGLIAGAFIYPTLSNLQLNIPYQNYLLFLVLPLGAATFVTLTKKVIPRFFQFSKFVVTGGLNFSIDFGVLNLLILSSSVATGTLYAIFKAVSFVVANTNSFFWNGNWTFSDSQVQKGIGEYIRFFGVSLIGLLINVGLASFVVGYIDPKFGADARIWANVGAACGSIGGLLWSFFGYKFLVFKD